MIETAENILQIMVLIFCTGTSVFRAIVGQSRIWALATFFFGSYMLGDVYWLVCLLFYDKTPDIPVVSDLSWYAAFIFLYLLLIQAAPPKDGVKRHLIQWAGPAFAVVMATFFMQWGAVLSNLIYAVLMGALFSASINRLMEKDRYRDQVFLSVMVLTICLSEYGLWLTSCFFSGNTLANPYYWFDLLLTVSCQVSLLAVRKAVPA